LEKLFAPGKLALTTPTGGLQRRGDGAGYRLDFVLPEGLLFIWKKRERLDKIDKDEAEEGEICCCCRDRAQRVERRERPAEAGESCWGGEIVDFRGDLARQKVLFDVVFCDHV